MKKLITLLYLSITSFSFANEFYIETTKETNGGYLWKIPAVNAEIQKEHFVYTPEITLLFTSERGNQFSINHHSFDFNNGFGIKYDDVSITFSLGMQYIFAGNDEGLEEGVRFYNTAKIKWEF
jgi:hypothetical protein